MRAQEPEGEPDHLFHNNGDGTFTDLSVKARVADEVNRYYGLTPVFVDVNNDGKIDLLVANDSTLSYLYLNRGDGTFEDASYTSGFGLNEDGREVASMGIAVGDYLNNGRLDFAITDFSDEYKLLFRNDGKSSFTEVSMRSGIGEDVDSFPWVGDGVLDYDNDGWLDLMFVNGHIYPAATDWIGVPRMPAATVFPQTAGWQIRRGSAGKGTGLAKTISGRGAAFGDLFNDGKIDVMINLIDGPPVLLRNINPDRHHWVELKLVGGVKSPLDAVGATVYLTANGMRQRQDVLSGGSYVSTNDQRPHFGLGDAIDAGRRRFNGLPAQKRLSDSRPLTASSPSRKAKALPRLFVVINLARFRHCPRPRALRQGPRHETDSQPAQRFQCLQVGESRSRQISDPFFVRQLSLRPSINCVCYHFQRYSWVGKVG